MRSNKISSFALLLFMVFLLICSGCSKLSGPSDTEVIKALNESGALKDLSLTEPVVVLKKIGPAKDGSWRVEVKLKFTYEVKDKQMSPVLEKVPVYYLIKSKDNTGHTVWKVKY
jgi:hypothetical protein